MSDAVIKKIQVFLQKEKPRLEGIFNKIRELETLNTAFKKYIAADYLPYCQVANRLNHDLIILVANGSIATQLRFQTPDLLKQFKQDPILKNISALQFKVRLPFIPSRLPIKMTAKMALLAPETAEIIDQMAASLVDPKLKAIMQRIAKRTK